MRISFVLSSLWLSGGMRVIVEYANRLAARGHQIALVAPGGTLDAEMLTEIAPSVQVRECRARRTDPMSAVAMAHLSLSLARAVPPADVIVSTHTPTTVATLVAGNILRRGRLVWLYQDYREMFAGRFVEDWLMRHALAWHELALVVSEYSRRELLSHGRGRVVVVGEGLSHPELFHPGVAEPRGPARRGRTVLFVGDMRPRKGLADFLDAARIVRARVPDIKLVVVSKEHCAPDTDLRVNYVYRPTRRELARLYASCDVFAAASWWESFGLPPLEAMACGAPVVMTDSRGVREYARHGENCLLTPPRNPGELAEAVVRVLTDDEFREKLRCNGPPSAARFKWSEAVDRFEAALRDLRNRPAG